MSSKPRIKPADAEDGRPVSISARLGRLQFHYSGKFRVLQIADIQDGPKVSKDTITLIEASLDATRPDLVIFSGNQIAGYDPAFADSFRKRRWCNEPIAESALNHTRALVRKAIGQFTEPLAARGIPWAVTYGNHDFQCGILADEQDDLYREFAGCMNPVAGSSPLALEPGTFALPIEASDGSGRITMSVMMVNSGDYADTADAGDGNGRQSVTEYAKYAANSRGWDLADSDGYGTPSPEAVEWLKRVQRELGRRNGDGQAVPAIAFQHIPPQEFYDCLREVPAYTPNAVEGAREFAGHCYVLDRDVCRPGSRLGEAIGCADVNVGEVDALREAGGYFALFCGHDHKNSFVGHVHDIDLGYAPTCGFECYGPKSRFRGIRLFEFREDNPMAYVTRMLTWGDLVGRYSSNELRVFFEDHCVTDLIGIRNELRRPQVFATLIGVGSMGLAALAHATLKLFRR